MNGDDIPNHIMETLALLSNGITDGKLEVMTTPIHSGRVSNEYNGLY